jgi:probable HAF family extracellular repeat protein
MKNRTFNFRLVASFLAMLVMASSLIAQDTAEHKQRRYKLYLVPPPGGGADSYSIQGPPVLHMLNNLGILGSIGSTAVTDPFFGFVIHGDRSYAGSSTELGALPPASINTAGAASISDNGLIVGFSGNGQLDPLTGFPEFEAVSFNGGGVTDLGNFGGNGSIAFSVNNRGQIAGYALNTVPDPYGSFLMGCSTNGCFPMGQQMRATLWDRGRLHDLGTLGGNDAVAGIINEAGQVAGTSYTNTIPNPTTGIPSQDPFFWENGRMVDVGNLGGTFAYAEFMNNRGQVIGQSTLAGNTVTHPFFWDRGRLTDIGTFGGTYGEAHSINDAGEVVGLANLADDQSHHAFFWKRGVLTDLGTLGGNSNAWAINSSGQVVGAAVTMAGLVHAFLWERGSGMVDLNDFIAPGSGLYLENAIYLNDRGQVSGDAVLDSGEERAYLLTPCDDEHRPGDCQSDLITAGAVANPNLAGTATHAPRRTGDDMTIGSFELHQRVGVPRH